MSLFHKLVSLLFLVSTLIFTNSASALNLPAGHVEKIEGNVHAISKNGVSRNLYKNSTFFSGDAIKTEPDALVTLRFNDKSRFELNPDSELKVNKFVYNQKGKNNSFSSRILKGAFRFVTGLVAKFKKDAMKVGLPVATIGIRGTHVVGKVTDTSATVILMEPEVAESSAILVSNEFGETFIDEPGYGTEVPDANSPPSPARRMSLRTIQNLMRSFQSISRIRPPMMRH